MNGAFSQLVSPVFYRKTIHIMIPVLLQQLISIGINFLDNIMVGCFGETQIAAASMSNEFHVLFYFITMGLGSGAIVMSSQYWGAKDYDHLKTVAAIALRLTGIFGLIFTLITVLWPQVILSVYTNDVNVIQAGTDYLRLLGFTFFFTGVSSSATYLLRSTGHVKIPLISSIIAFCLNLFFNWVFIFGMFGAPRMEIVGAAVGTVIARTFEFCMIFGFFIFKDKNFGFRLRHLTLSGKEIIGTYMKYSIPVLISDTFLGVGISLTSVIIGHVSEVMMAANSIVETANQLVTVANIGFSGAAGVVIGNSIGEGETERAFQEGLAYSTIAMLFGCLVSVILVTLGGPYLKIYRINAETVEVAKSLFLCLAITSPLQMLSYVNSKGVLRGGGDTRFMMVADIGLLWFVSLPLGYLAAMNWHLTPFWILFLLKFEYPAKGLVCFARFLSKKWIKVIQEDKESDAVIQ